MKKKEIIEELYNETKDNLKPTAEVKKAQDKFVEIREMFLKEIGIQYRQKLEKVTDAVIGMCLQQEKQFFFEGYKRAEILINNDKRGI